MLGGILVLLLITTGFLYKEKRTFEEQNRRLIIQNDSIMAVNILLNDSLKQKKSGTIPRKSLVAK